MQERQSWREQWGRAAVLACLVLSAASALRASVVVPMSLTELVEAADIVVDATVEEVHPVEGPDGIERLVSLRVAATWKGRTDTTAYVRLAGGRLGRIETRVTGVPVVVPGDRLVWFLVTHPRGGYSVLGLHQGALRTVLGPDGEARVLAPARLPGARGDVSRAPRLVDDLASDVRALGGRGAER